MFRLIVPPLSLASLLLIGLSLPVQKISAAEFYEIRGDRVETTREEGGVRRAYQGNVEARMDSVSVRSGQAEYRSEAEEVVFFGDTEAVGPGRRMFADSLKFGLRTGEWVARGGVRVEEEGRSLRAFEAVLSGSQGGMQASGGVEAWFPGSGVRLFSDSLLVPSRGDSGVARGSARLIRVAGDTLAVSGKTIRVWDGGRRVEVEGAVELAAGVFTARSGLAACDPDSVVLTVAPVISRYRLLPGGADHVEVRGRRLAIHAPGGRVRQVLATGEGRIHLRAFGSGGGDSGWSRMEGDSVRVALEGEMLRRTEAWGSARAVRRDVDSASVELTAGRITAHFPDGRLQQVEGEGTGRAATTSADGYEKGRLSADRIEIGMEENRMGGMILTGHALCEYFPDPRTAKKKGGKSRLAGERIRMVLKAGALQRAAVEKTVIGTYWMTDEERKSGD